MNTATKETLKKLQDFCTENKCSFVRSSNSSNDLVLSVRIGPDSFEDVYFAEEIGTESIKHEWYTI